VDAAGKGTSIPDADGAAGPVRARLQLYPIRAARTYEKSTPGCGRYWQKLPGRGEWAKSLIQSEYGRVLVRAL